MTAYRLTDKGSDVLREIARASMLAVGQAAEALLQAANETVPHDEGGLEGSGDTDTGADSNGRPVAAVSYSTPYARRQHEDLTLDHQGNGRARWLELAAGERSDDLLRVVADVLREETRR